MGFKDIRRISTKIHNPINTPTISLNDNSLSKKLLQLFASPVFANSSLQVWTCHSITESDPLVQKMFNDTWCQGYDRWLWEAAGFNNSCGGKPSTLIKDGCINNPTPPPPTNGCPQGQLPCSEDYPSNCNCNDGRDGTQICHKKGCSIGGVSGPSCSWGNGSYCEECNCGPAEPPPPAPIPGPTCPVSTKGCVPCHKSEQYCRYEQGEEYGFLGWACQNNNPGNIKYSQYRIDLITQMGGIAPCGEKGTFMIFATYVQGRESLKAYLKAINAGLHSRYPGCGNCTLRYFFGQFAENMDYATAVAIIMGGGITPDTKLSWVVNNRLNDFVDAIQQREGFFTM